MLISWIVYPLVLTGLCAGLGLLCRDGLRLAIPGRLVLPLGFAALTAVAGLTTTNPVTAPATITLVTVLAIAGLVQGARSRAWRGLDPWPAAAALGVLLVFGAPVILTGHPTFTGYLKLDDTATWLEIVDRVISHGRSLAGLPASTYRLNLQLYLHTEGYPIGAFLPWGIARGLTGTDAAWVLQPYLAWMAGMLALTLDALLERALPDRRARALIAFIAAQPALLYGYAEWGGIKEVAGAVLLAVLAAVTAEAVAAGADRRAQIAPLGLTAGALAGVLGPGAVAWLAPALVVIAGTWLVRARDRRRALVEGGAAAGVAAVLMLPMWIELSAFLKGSSELFLSANSNTATGESGLVSLYHPITVLQLGGIWPVQDFRDTAGAGRTAPFLIIVAAGLIAALYVLARGRLSDRAGRGIAVYLAVALAGCVIVWAGGSDAWVVAKSLASAAPVLLAAALLGLAALWRLGPAGRPVAVLAVAAVAVGVLWSNALGYGGVTLAPRGRLAELQQLAAKAGKGPTLIDQYDVYADRHFLRGSDPVEPAEYRSQNLPLADGTLLTQSAWADLDAFSITTIDAYPSLVTSVTPVESRPASIYRLAWASRWYQLWRLIPGAAKRLVAHIPFGDSAQDPYCGNSEPNSSNGLCAIDPAQPAPCATVRSAAAQATAAGAELVAAERPAPIVARAGQTQWPGRWYYDAASQTLTPTEPGTDVAHIRLVQSTRYKLWLGGTFARGFEVSVDGRHLGDLKNEIGNTGSWAPVGALALKPGIHTITIRYPKADLLPGSGASDWTALTGLALVPETPRPHLVTVAPAQASTLCGRSLDWLDVIKPR